MHAVVAERDRVHPEVEGLARSLTWIRSKPLARSHSTSSVREHLGADRRQLLRQHCDQHVDVHVALGERLRPAPPSRPPRYHAASCAAAASWVRVLAGADQHRAGLDDHHVAALERSGRDHAADRDAGRLVEADRRRVLAAPPPLVPSWVITVPFGRHRRSSRGRRPGTAAPGRARGSGSGRPPPRRRRPAPACCATATSGSKRWPASSVALVIALVSRQRKLSGGQSRTSSSRPYSESTPQAGSAAHSVTTRIVRRVRSLRPANQAAVGEGVRDVGDGRAASGARPEGRSGRRAGRRRAIRRRSGPPPRRMGPPPAVRGRHRAARAPAGPREEARRRRASLLHVRGPDLLDRVPKALDAADPPARSASSPIPKTATITFSEKSSRMMSSRSRISCGDAVAGRAGSPDVDREPQRDPRRRRWCGRRGARRARQGRGSRGSRSRVLAKRSQRLVEQLVPRGWRRSAARRRGRRSAARWGSSTRPGSPSGRSGPRRPARPCRGGGSPTG